LTCVHGACGIAGDKLCKGGERCRQSTGLCRVTCRADGSCCPAGQACVDPGVLSANFGCDTSANAPCGDNGDGTFGACCSNFNERCVNGECVPKDDCPTRGLSTQGLCCPKPEQLCHSIGDEEFCCEDGQVCCALMDGSEICCAADRCLAPGLCCAPGAAVKCSGAWARCAPPEYQCCGEYSCLDCNSR
jgi:hypothetical protein